jgi:hypothetical protein
LDAIRWDEKAGLRQDAPRPQVIAVLEAQEIKEADDVSNLNYRRITVLLQSARWPVGKDRVKMLGPSKASYTNTPPGTKHRSGHLTGILERGQFYTALNPALVYAVSGPPKEVSMGLHSPEIPCKVCREPVDLTLDLSTDEYGNAIHEDCYITRIIATRWLGSKNLR